MHLPHPPSFPPHKRRSVYPPPNEIACSDGCLVSSDTSDHPQANYPQDNAKPPCLQGATGYALPRSLRRFVLGPKAFRWTPLRCAPSLQPNATAEARSHRRQTQKLQPASVTASSGSSSVGSWITNVALKRPRPMSSNLAPRSVTAKRKRPINRFHSLSNVSAS